MLDPGMWEGEEFNAVSIHARLFYVGLWSNADDEGRITGSSRELIYKIYPGENHRPEIASIESWRAELATTGPHPLIQVYDHNGKKYISINSFRKHQPTKWWTPSKHPAPPDIPAVAATNQPGQAVSAGVALHPWEEPDRPRLDERGEVRCGEVRRKDIPAERPPGVVSSEVKAIASKKRGKSAAVNPEAIAPDLQRLWAVHLEASGRSPTGLYALTAGRVKALGSLLEWCRGDAGEAERGVRAVGASRFHRGENERGNRYDALEDAPFKSREAFVKWVERAAPACAAASGSPSKTRYRGVQDVLCAIAATGATHLVIRGLRRKITRHEDAATWIESSSGQDLRLTDWLLEEAAKAGVADGAVGAWVGGQVVGESATDPAKGSSDRQGGGGGQRASSAWKDRGDETNTPTASQGSGTNERGGAIHRAAS